jgi:hypothetical protein
VWEDVDSAFDTFLAHVRPAVSGHPLPFALWTLVFSKAALFALVRRQTIAFRQSLPKKLI